MHALPCSLVCTSFDAPTVRLLRIALTTNLTQFGVRPVDIDVTDITCLARPRDSRRRRDSSSGDGSGSHAASGTGVAFAVEVVRLFSGPVTFALLSLEYWSGVYEVLSAGSATLFPAVEGQLRYDDEGNSVPVVAPEDEGSGSGDGQGGASGRPDL